MNDKKTSTDAQVERPVATQEKLRLNVKRTRLQTNIKAGPIRPWPGTHWNGDHR